MDYLEATEWINKLNLAKGMVFGLDTMSSLLSAMGGFSLPCVHIAGTNGKGSVCNFVTSILFEAGYKVGTYTSPSVGEPLEIIRVNGENISEELYASYLTDIRKIVEENDIPATAFEIQTVTAFMYFISCKCDICVVECGLGGSLDATNVIESTLVTAFTSIGMDHMHILGDTIEDIAKEKAGIIKENVTAIMQPNTQSVENIIKEKIKEANGKLIVVSKAKNICLTSTGISFEYKNLGNFRIEQPGMYQVMNSCEAIEVALSLKEKGFEKITVDSIRNGLEKMNLEFRFETISCKPRIIIDGAHNEDAVMKLMDSVKSEFNNSEIIFVIGIFKDKDYRRVIELSKPIAKQYITITPPNSRALPSEELANCIKEMTNHHVSVYNVNGVHEGARYVLQNAKKDDIIVAFGSLSYLKQFKDSIASEL